MILLISENGKRLCRIELERSMAWNVGLSHAQCEYHQPFIKGMNLYLHRLVLQIGVVKGYASLQLRPKF